MIHFNLSRLRDKTKVRETVIRCMLFADYVARTSHTQSNIYKDSMDRFSRGYHDFGIFFFSRVPPHISHTSRAQFSSHARVITSSSMSPCIPSGGRYMGQCPLVTWSAVCSAPQSQQSLVDSPQRSMFAPNLPTPVRSLFSRVQARRDRPTPCPLFDGVGMNVCSLVGWMCSEQRDSYVVNSWTEQVNWGHELYVTVRTTEAMHVM